MLHIVIEQSLLALISVHMVLPRPNIALNLENIIELELF
uniref:Uncharacterized protein n=1 Tax=Lepeophtheirus salmonis TaxID=72036 RepID=A0A0K2T375_LEPSM